MAEIYVNLIIGNQPPLTIIVSQEETVGQLKRRIIENMGLNPEQTQKIGCQISLLAPTNTINNPNFSLKDYGIQEDMNIYFSLAVEKANKCFFNFLDLKNKVKSNFSKNAPDWRIACNGCNLQAKCQNKQCKAYNKYVIIQKGFVKKMNLAQEMYECICPICKQQTDEAGILSYCNCNIEIQGLKTSKQKFKFKEVANTGEYNRFEPEAGKSQKISWVFLNITTTPLK